MCVVSICKPGWTEHRLGRALTALLFAAVVGQGAAASQSRARQGNSPPGSRIHFLHGGSAAEIPLLLADGAALVPARIHQSPPQSVLLDTACQQSSWDLPGRSASSPDSLLDVVLPGLWVETALVRQEVAALSRQLGQPLAGVLGDDVLRSAAISLDYDRLSTEWYPPENFRPPAGEAHRVRIAWVNGLPTIRVHLRLEGKTIEAPLTLSTGSPDVFVLPQSLLPTRVASTLASRRLPAVATTCKGTFPGWQVRAEWAELAGYRLSSPLVTILDSAATTPSGWIGGRILEKFRLLLALGTDQLWLIPNRQFIFPLEADASGLLLEATGPAYNRYDVISVVAGSPAAQAGVQVGDRLVSVDGEPAENLTLDQLRRVLRQAGQRVQLVVEQAGRRRSLTLALQRLL